MDDEFRLTVHEEVNYSMNSFSGGSAVISLKMGTYPGLSCASAPHLGIAVSVNAAQVCCMGLHIDPPSTYRDTIMFNFVDYGKHMIKICRLLMPIHCSSGTHTETRERVNAG